MAALGLHCDTWALHCCPQAVSGCGKWGILSNCSVRASQCSVFSCCGAWGLGPGGFRSAAGGLSSVAWVQLPHRRWNLRSQTTEGTRVPCISRGILNYWATRDDPSLNVDMNEYAECMNTHTECTNEWILLPQIWAQVKGRTAVLR